MTFSIYERVWRFGRTPKGSLLGVFGSLLSVMGSLTGWPIVFPHVISGIAGASVVELIARRRMAWPSSAVLSGMIVAFVLGPETAWWVTLCVGALATASKYLLRTTRGHIFNPAALALLVSIPLFATGQSWWGAGADLPLPFLLLVLAGGAVIVDRINKFPLVLSFVGVYFSVFSLAGMANPGGVAEMFRAPFVQAALFLALFMLTDPPTSPSRYVDQVWVGALAAGTACAAQLLGLGQAYLLVGVLAGDAALAVQRSIRFARVQFELTGARR
jgi:Na+-translocating ferredoxin:NAD+ oxidoreductase RnfD subunit